jgi:parallel beta-helix repeat protein
MTSRGCLVAVVLLALFGGGCTSTIVPSSSGPDADVGGLDAAANDAGLVDGDGGRIDSGLVDPDPISDAGSVPVDAAPANPCLSIAPGASAAANHATIQGCLNNGGKAHLTAGEFPISTGITMPASAELVGLSTAKPTLLLQPGNGVNFMVSFPSNSPADAKARVANLNINANNAIGNYANASIVTFLADNNVLADCDLYNTVMPSANQHAAGAYVMCSTCKGNEMYNNFYGLIFRGESSTYPNIADANDIHDNKCDPITFAGYGIATNNTIHENGWDCENGPIPGGGIYSLLNNAGGVISGNTVSNTCGHGIDMDRVSNFVIENNSFTNPGYQFGGAAPWCTGAAAAFLIDVSDSTVTGNTFANDDRPLNRLGGDFAGRPPVFQASGAAAFADLPHGGDQAIGFVLAKWPDGTGYGTMSNTIENNVMRANCSGNCVGLGYFASRGTGYDGTDWNAGTTSYFRGNDPTGSQHGSKRCGGNWYAADTTCDEGSPAPCNVDDFQHNPPGGDFARNDGCSFY